MYKSVLEALESDFHYVNLNPFCELHLSKHGLDTNPLKKDDPMYIRKILTLLNFSDGKHLCEIADRLDVPILDLAGLSRILEQKKLLRKT
jgi:aminopeptidase-like protein